MISGIIAEESASAIVVKRSEGATDVIPREQIEQVKSTGVSLMPEGLEKGLIGPGDCRSDRVRAGRFARTARRGGATCP